jgi:phosphonate transport system substrate-binding protein
MKLINSIFILTLVMLLSACRQDNRGEVSPLSYSDKPVSENVKYSIAIHPLHNPQKLFHVFGPLIKYLNENVPNLKAKLVASKNYSEFDKSVKAQEYDFILPNPYQTLLAMDVGYNVIAKQGDDFNFKGIFIVRNDSPIRSVRDLKGKTISYPAKTALAAAMMPQVYLYENGVNPFLEMKQSYVGSQESAIINAFIKKSDIAATWPIPWFAFQREIPHKAKFLKVIWETESLINNSFMAHSRVPKKIADAVAKALAKIHETNTGHEILHRMEISKYELANNDDYLTVKKMLDRHSKIEGKNNEK